MGVETGAIFGPSSLLNGITRNNVESSGVIVDAEALTMPDIIEFLDSVVEGRRQAPQAIYFAGSRVNSSIDPQEIASKIEKLGITSSLYGFSMVPVVELA